MSGLQMQVHRAVLWVLYFSQCVFVVLILWVARAATGLRAFNAPLVLAAEAPASVAAAMAGLLLEAGADMGRRRKRRRVGAPPRGERQA